MNIKLIIAIGVAALCTASFSNDKYLYENNFNNPDKLPSLCKGAEYRKTVGIGNSGCLKFSYSDNKFAGMVHIPLDAKKAAGRKIVIRAEIKAEKVQKPLKSWLGPKLMIAYTSDNGQKSHPGTMIAGGTYGFTKFSRMVRVSSNITDISLNIGLQNCAGTLWFDNVSVELLPENADAQNFVKPVVLLQKTPKYRGVMISPRRQKINNWTDMDELGKWNANIIRYQMRPANGQLSSKEYIKWIKQEIPHIDRCLDKCREYGMKMILDLHKGPGTKSNKILSNVLTWDAQSQQILIELWRVLAKHYKGNKSIYAYEILNEPRESGTEYNPNIPDWYDLAPIVAKEIRKIDPNTPIIISPLEWSSPSGYYTLKPYNIPGLIYTVHVYRPREITHQGVHKSKVGFKYPGNVAGIYWDKKQLRKTLAPVRDFQLKYNVPIFVGEFSCIRWAPGDSAYNYIRDCIELFEEYGWDWTYHAFREWDGWSVEHGNNPKDRSYKKATSRKNLLLKYMKKNK